MEGSKIKVTNPVVEMDGDEMTRIIWKIIRDKVFARNLCSFLIFIFLAHSPSLGPRYQVLRLEH